MADRHLHGSTQLDTITDGSSSSTITNLLTNAGKGATSLQPSDIANNVTTTTTGKVLDATQGKLLNDNKQDKSTLESDVASKGFTKNTGTVTSVAVKMNGATKGTVTTSGTIDLGTVITSHQDISGKLNTTGGNFNSAFNGYWAGDVSIKAGQGNVYLGSDEGGNVTIQGTALTLNGIIDNNGIKFKTNQLGYRTVKGAYFDISGQGTDWKNGISIQSSNDETKYVNFWTEANSNGNKVCGDLGIYVTKDVVAEKGFIAGGDGVGFTTYDNRVVYYNNSTPYTQTLQAKSGTIALLSDCVATPNEGGWYLDSQTTYNITNGTITKSIWHNGTNKKATFELMFTNPVSSSATAVKFLATTLAYRWQFQEGGDTPVNVSCAFSPSEIGATYYTSLTFAQEQNTGEIAWVMHTDGGQTPPTWLEMNSFDTRCRMVDNLAIWFSPRAFSFAFNTDDSDPRISCRRVYRVTVYPN